MPDPVDPAEVLALYETTQDICSRLDLDEALTAIVARARQLLGADVAYLATTDDEEQVLRMRAFDNIRSPLFRALVMEYGVGLGGAVAARRCPVVVPDYMDDATLDHSSHIDVAVVDEGLRGAIGVPVEFEGRLLAILFVAKRTQARFTEHQATLLASLANSAAIALNNAQMYARLSQAMAIHESVMELALSGRGPGPVATALAELIGGPVLLLDWAAQVLASAADPTDPTESGEPLAVPTRAELEAAAADDEAAEFELAGTRGQVIALGGQLEGYLLVRPGAGDPELARIAVQQAATVFALEFARLRSAEEAEAQLRGDLLDELLRGTPEDEAALARHARRLGVDLGEPHVVAVMRLDGNQSHQMSAIWRRVTQLARFGRDPGQIAVVVRGSRLVLLIAAPSVPDADEQVRRLVQDCRATGLPAVVAGLGRRCGGVGDYSPSYAEAQRAADAAARMARLAPVVSFEELEYHQLVLGAQPADALIDLARSQLAPLTEHDGTSHGGSLTETLRTYLSSCGNLEATARKLAIHPNTLRGRVARIEELTGRDLQAASTRLDFQLALATVDLAG